MLNFFVLSSVCSVRFNFRSNMHFSDVSRRDLLLNVMSNILCEMYKYVCRIETISVAGVFIHIATNGMAVRVDFSSYIFVWCSMACVRLLCFPYFVFFFNFVSMSHRSALIKIYCAKTS